MKTLEYSFLMDRIKQLEEHVKELEEERDDVLYSITSTDIIMVVEDSDIELTDELMRTVKREIKTDFSFEDDYCQIQWMLENSK